MSNLFANLTIGKVVAIGTATMLALVLITSDGVNKEEDELRVAMIGNSLMYYNDLPRLLEAMSGGRLSQDSCLHGGASLSSHLLYGNGMFSIWNTGQARMWNFDSFNYEAASEAYQEYMDSADGDSASYQLDTSSSHIYDYGACTARQLLLGVDERLVALYESDDDNSADNNNRRKQRQRRIQSHQQILQYRELPHSQSQLEEKIIAPVAEDGRHRLEDAAEDGYYYNLGDDDYLNEDDSWTENYPLSDDGTNPCLQNANYYFFKQSQFGTFNGGVPDWDYILLNDNSRGPCCTYQRNESLDVLDDIYVSLILKTGAVPVFMITHAYWPSTRDMSGLVDIPTFMSLTYEGYRQYALNIGQLLPEQQQPKLAPVGLAFLMIWEESPNVWKKLMHQDEIHLTPSGTFLEGLVVYATLFGHLPSPNIVLTGQTSNLFSNARWMTPTEDLQEGYPSLGDAKYLYHIASRIMNGEFPRSFINFTHNESVNFTATKRTNYNNN